MRARPPQPVVLAEPGAERAAISSSRSGGRQSRRRTSATASPRRSKPLPAMSSVRRARRDATSNPRARQSAAASSALGSLGPLELVEAQPQVVHPRQRVALGQLEHDAAASVCRREPVTNGAEVGHVVGDVATDGDVGPGVSGATSGQRPSTARRGDDPRRRAGGDRLEHVGLTVDRDQAGAPSRERQAGRAAPHPHVEHRAPVAQCLQCPRRGRRRLGRHAVAPPARLGARTARPGTRRATPARRRGSPSGIAHDAESRPTIGGLERRRNAGHALELQHLVGVGAERRRWQP